MDDYSLCLMPSVTRLGDFGHLLVTNFIIKVTQMFRDLLGTCENH